MDKPTPGDIFPRGTQPTLASTDFGNVGYTTVEPRQGIEFGGAATGLTRDLLPQPIQQVLDLLGVPENTVALWVWANLLERQLIRFLSENGASEIRLRSLVNQVRNNDMADEPIPF